MDAYCHGCNQCPMDGFHPSAATGLGKDSSSTSIFGAEASEHNLEMKLQDQRARRSSLHLGDYCQNALPANIPSKAGLSDSFKSRKAKALTLLFFHPREAFGKDVSPAFLQERSHHLFLWDASQEDQGIQTGSESLSWLRGAGEMILCCQEFREKRSERLLKGAQRGGADVLTSD